MDNFNDYELLGRHNEFLPELVNTPDQPPHSQPINDLDRGFSSTTLNAAPTTFHRTGTNAAPNTALDMAADDSGDDVPLRYYHRASRNKRSRVSKKRVPKFNHVQNNLTSSQKDEQDKKLDEIKKCLGEKDVSSLDDLSRDVVHPEWRNLITEAWHEKRMAELEDFKVHVDGTAMAPFCEG